MVEADISTTQPINIQVATQNATSYLHSLEPYIGGQITDVRLEEVELSEDDKFWFVTLGFDRPIETPFALVKNQMHREYKQFKIDAVTGDVKAMKIRTV